MEELIINWGPPDAMYTASDGRRTVRFSHSRFYQGTEYYCLVTFQTDAQGIIRASTVRGNLGGCNRFLKRIPLPVE